MHAPLEVMLISVRCAACPQRLRHVQAMMAKGDLDVADATVRPWTANILPVLAAVFRQCKRPVGVSCA